MFLIQRLNISVEYVSIPRTRTSRMKQKSVKFLVQPKIYQNMDLAYYGFIWTPQGKEHPKYLTSICLQSSMSIMEKMKWVLVVRDACILSREKWIVKK